MVGRAKMVTIGDGDIRVTFAFEDIAILFEDNDAVVIASVW